MAPGVEIHDTVLSHVGYLSLPSRNKEAHSSRETKFTAVSGIKLHQLLWGVKGCAHGIRRALDQHLTHIDCDLVR